MPARPARTLMVFGTASDVGKSMLVAGLCRALSDAGVSVAPFKAQNMARNAYVCADGSEIGVAQAVQAIAARVEPCFDHNPILIKPEPEMRSQLVVHGKALGRFGYAELAQHRPTLQHAMRVSLTRLRAQHELVILEGAGSPAEVNLQAHDLPNLTAAREAEAEILLVVDIDRGGAFAAVVGTLELLPADLRARVRGIVINKFRGDVRLLDPALTFLKERTGVPVLGVVPYCEDLRLPDEDSVALQRHRGQPRAALDALEIAVLDTPCLANFEDLLPFAQEPGVTLRLVDAPRELLEADLVVLAGSKSTVHDLQWLQQRQLARALHERHARGLPIVGICAGAQMLGQRIEDPHAVESSHASIAGLGLLPHHTRFERDKHTQRVRGVLHAWGLAAPVEGFLLHHGRLVREAGEAAVILEGGLLEGVADATVLATMMHRVFDQAQTRGALLDRLRAARGLPSAPRPAPLPDAYAIWSEHVKASLDWSALRRIVLG